MHSHLLLIDATGLVFRAFFSISPLSAPDGTPVNAVYGLLRIMMRVYRELPIAATAVVFDAGAHTFRNEMFADYKAHRPAPPDDLRPQFALAIETMRATAAPVYVERGFEADDIIATLATQARAQGQEVAVLTSDRDLLQLLAPGVELLMPARGGDLNKVTAEAFPEQYGFPIERFVDFKALMGDPSDNIPGIAGVGEKTAAKLVATYGKLEQIYANLDIIKPDSLRKKLTPAREQVFLYRDLVTLRRDVPVSYDFAARTMPDFGNPELIALMDRFGFGRARQDALTMGDLQPKS